MRYRLIGFFILLWPAIGHPLNLSEAITIGLQQSPILAPSLKAEQTLAQITQRDRWRRWLLNEPQFLYSSTDDDTGHSYGLNETFAFPGKAFGLMSLDKAHAESQRAEWLARRFETAKIITEAYTETAADAAAVDIQQRNVVDLETLAHSLRARYEAGLATQAEVIGTELQTHQAASDLAAAKDKWRVAETHLCRLLGTSVPLDHLTLPDDLEPSVLDQLEPATGDALRAQASLSVAQANASVAWWNQAPDLVLGVSRNHYLFLPGSPSGKEYSTSYTVGMTAPILFLGSERVEAHRQQQQAIADQAQAQLQLLSAQKDGEDAADEYKRDRARLQEIRQSDLPLAEALMDSTFSAYKSGKLGFAELVLARKTLTDLRSQDISLRVAIIAAHLRCLGYKGTSS